MYLRYPDLRTFVFQLVVWISASDIVYSIANGIGNPRDGTDACYVQAIFIQFFGLASIMWTATIAYTVEQVYLKDDSPIKTLEDAARLKMTFHYIIWPVVTLCTILPATTGNYGSAAGWCWIDVIKNSTAGTVWRFFCFYIPLWAVCIYNLVVYAKVRKRLQETAEREGKLPDRVKRLTRLVYYPLILVVCYIFGTINRIVSIFSRPVFGIVIIHAVGMSSQGTLNAIVYGMNPQVKNKIRAIFGYEDQEDFSEQVQIGAQGWG